MDTHRVRKFFSRIGWSMVAFLAIMQGLTTVLLLAGESLFPQLFESYESSMVMQALVQCGVALPVMLLILRPLPRCEPQQRISYPPRMVAALVVISMGITFLANIGTLLLVQAMELVTGRTFFNPVDTALDSMSLLSTLVFTVIIAPLVEELIFRGILLERLRPWGDRVCIFASGLFFGLFHCSLFQFFYAFCLGAIFAYVALRTGGIRLPIFLHMVVNLLGGTLLPALSMSTSPLVLAAVNIGVLVVIGAAVVLFFRLRSTVVLLPGSAPFTEAQKSRLLLGNAGVVAFLLLSLGFTAMALVI